jgi:hypothetical protein
LLGVKDQEVLEYAFNEDRIVITANIKDFEKFALKQLDFFSRS